MVVMLLSWIESRRLRLDSVSGLNTPDGTDLLEYERLKDATPSPAELTLPRLTEHYMLQCTTKVKAIVRCNMSGLRRPRFVGVHPQRGLAFSPEPC
jgi:hypothetical protein